MRNGCGIDKESFINDYASMYAAKTTSAGELVGMLRRGWNIWVDIALAQPGNIMKAMEERAKQGELSGITIHNMLEVYPAPWYREDLKEQLRGVSWFSGGNARSAVNGGYADLMPGYYRDIPSLLRENRQIDCVCVAVSPMDRHGYFSMGPTSSASEGILTRAKHIFLEVNRQMPRSLSAPVVHISQVTALCESDYPLPVVPPVRLDEVSRTIGAYIAEEIPDEATIQLGIGAIPDAVGLALKTKHNLGIHTELFGDSMMELIECGAVTNAKKPIHTGRSVTTFAYGSKRVYDYIDDNRAIEVLSVDYVNDPKIIALHPKFISVNAAVEADFFGQVCAESLGTRHLSGTGGQVDYVRGAVESPGGKSFIAFPSTAQNGTVSRIRPVLTPGAIVTTGKNDVDYIVTEYGVAKLRGKTLSERAAVLIRIAHPRFRGELTYEAKQRGIMI